MSPAPTANAPKPPRLLDQVRDKLRKLHYSPRTEEAYVGWIKRYIWFHNKRHPREMGAPEVEAFLSSHSDFGYRQITVHQGKGGKAISDNAHTAKRRCDFSRTCIRVGATEVVPTFKPMAGGNRFSGNHLRTASCRCPLP